MKNDEALSVACPKCWASASQPCSLLKVPRWSGKLTSKRVHRERLEAYKEYVDFGDVARDRCHEQCQYAARETELYSDLRILGSRSDYHSMKIHKDDVETFVRRYLQKYAGR